VEWLLAIVFVEIKEKRKKMATVDEKCEVFVVKYIPLVHCFPSNPEDPPDQNEK
jgi:hypothetical protein